MSGDDVRKVRRRLHLTQEELAERLGVSSNTVARWERGEVQITEPAARLVATQEVEVLSAPSEEALKDIRSFLALGEDAPPAVWRAAQRRALRGRAAINNFIRARNQEIASARLRLAAARNVGRLAKKKRSSR